jgi:hemerythrin superfamily protein
MTMMEKLKRTGRRMAETLGGDTATDEDRDILDTLRREHEEVAELLDRMVESGSSSERKALLASIRSALVPHLRAEEKVVYDAILAVGGKESKLHGEEGYLEHSLADKTLASLFKIGNAMSVEFSAGAKVLKNLVTHHVEEEESNVWADVREHFSDEKRVQMNRAFEAAKKRVRVPMAA